MDKKNIIIYHEDKELYILSDLHGNFDLLLNELGKKKYTNSIFVIAGDIGVGFKKYEYYQHIFNTINEILKENNNFIYCIRGNHDDPSYFSENKLYYSNIQLIRDYTIIQVGDKSILCIGGALSIDRKYRIEEYKYRKDFLYQFNSHKVIYPSYWNDEKPIFNEDILSDISKICKIKYVISHTSPHFAFKNHKNDIGFWLKLDPNLEKDLNEERATMTKIYEKLINDGHPINKWIYGHFHQKNEEKINGIEFITLSNFDKTKEIIKIK